MTSFNFDLNRLGLNSNEIQKITDYSNNKKILDNCIYTVVSSTSFILAVEAKYYIDKDDILSKFTDVIFPIISKGFHNNLVFIYSKYILCNPIHKDHMIDWIKKFFNHNTLEYFYESRKENIGYLEKLELLLIDFKKKENNFR